MPVSNEISDKNLGMLVGVVIVMLAALAGAVYTMWTTVWPNG